METLVNPGTESPKPKYAERLRELREEAGLTQQQLADKVRMHQPDIAQFETGRRELKDGSLLRIARFFEVNPFYLSGDSDQKIYDKM